MVGHDCPIARFDRSKAVRLLTSAARRWDYRPTRKLAQAPRWDCSGLGLEPAAFGLTRFPLALSFTGFTPPLRDSSGRRVGSAHDLMIFSFDNQRASSLQANAS
jgi:hypothetical protein